MSKVEIHLNDEQEEKVEFSFNGIDYSCEYMHTILFNDYMVSFNSVTGKISYAEDESLYAYMTKETLKEDNKTITNVAEVIAAIEEN